MPVHTLDNCSMSYGIYSTNEVVPYLSAPGYVLNEELEAIGTIGLFKKIWGVSKVHKRQGFEIDTSDYISNGKKSFKLKRLMFTIPFLPFLFNSQFDVIEQGRLFYGQLSYNLLMDTLSFNQHLLFGDNAGVANLINPDWCLAVELISVDTEITDAGHRIVTAEFTQKFLGNSPY